MNIRIEPVEVPSLKEACARRLEGLILSGELKIGQQLPPERALAELLSVSRPVVHAALVELAARGLVNILPRRGVFVNDFRTFGSVAMLESLLSFQNGQLDSGIRRSLIEFRLLLERETARLAALNRSTEQIRELEAIVQQEKATESSLPLQLTELDFKFHHAIALASGNTVYPLILSSFKNIHTHLAGQFFQHNPVETHKTVHQFHSAILAAICDQDEMAAQTIMTEMLIHGAQKLPQNKE